MPRQIQAQVIAVMGMISAGFLSFMLFTSNPFERLYPIPLEGRDLNPLLQDPGLAIHPPLLYMGYVGFSVAFAFAIAAMIGGRLDSTWARWSRPWTNVAWLFLTAGITLGSWWAYIPAGVTVLGLVVRTSLEDRMLREELEGYEAYAERVPYRLVPHVW